MLQDNLELQKMLNSTNLQEIKNSLQKKSTQIAPAVALKVKHQYEVPTKQFAMIDHFYSSHVLNLRSL